MPLFSKKPDWVKTILFFGFSVFTFFANPSKGATCEQLNAEFITTLSEIRTNLMVKLVEHYNGFGNKSFELMRAPEGETGIAMGDYAKRIVELKDSEKASTQLKNAIKNIEAKRNNLSKLRKIWISQNCK